MMNELQLITHIEENDAFVMKKHTELQKLYANECIAVDNESVIAHSKFRNPLVFYFL